MRFDTFANAKASATCMLVLLAALAAASVGCEMLGLGKKTTPAEAPLMSAGVGAVAGVPTVGAAGAADRVPLDRVAAVVNSTIITLSEVEGHAMKAAAPRLAATTDPEERARILREVLPSALDDMIVSELLAQEGAKLALTVTSDEVDRAIAGIMERFKLDAPAFKEALLKEGYTPETHRAEVRQHLLRMKVIAMKVRTRVSTEDDMLRAYYEKLKRTVSDPPKVHLFMIMFTLPPKSDPDFAKIKAEALEKAKKIEGELKAGKDFAALAGVYAPDGPAGGDWGVISLDGLIKEVRVLVSPMKIGEVRVGADELQVRVVKVADRIESSVAAFETVKDSLLERYIEEETARLSALYFEELKALAYVDIKIPELNVGKSVASAVVTPGS